MFKHISFSYCVFIDYKDKQPPWMVIHKTWGYSFLEMLSLSTFVYIDIGFDYKYY